MSQCFDLNSSASKEAPHDKRPPTTMAEDAIEGAAEALREVEVEAAQRTIVSASSSPPTFEISLREVDAMNIGEHRHVAASLNAPNSAELIDRDHSAKAIRDQI